MMAELLNEMWMALDLFREIRIADVVDIALVTTLLYTAIALIRRTQAAFVAIGILMLGVLYVAARALDLRLTAWIFQGFFAVFLVILVVIFQEELRQLFERVAMWSLRRSTVEPARLDLPDILVKTLADLARDRVGALVVLPGLRPISRYVQGGIDLDARLSEPLLKSIFDPHSPGHDGAVIVDQNRVSKFATHLPLSTDFQQLARVGTRHGAALGLSELTDALCLVVSEERGEISTAHHGRLRRLVSPNQLSGIVRDFLREIHPTPEQRPVYWQLIRENWVEKLASLALVLGLWWLFVPGSRQTSLAYEVPVQVSNLPAGLWLEQVDPPTITLIFSGQRRDFYLFNPNRSGITIDASLAKLGRRTFHVTDDDVRYPKDLNLDEIQPDRVKISVQAVTPPDAPAQQPAADSATPRP